MKCESVGGTEKISEDEPIIFGCNESIYNHALLGTQKLEAEQKYLIECVKGCGKEDGKKVYGSNQYADISRVCAAGQHAGVIQVEGGKF